MCRKLLVLGVLLVGGFWVVKHTSLASYVRVLWAHVRNDVRESVPTQIELDRARIEIAAMDRDISNMLRPIAEHMATIKRLKKDIDGTRARLTEQKSVLLAMTKDLEGDPPTVEYGGEVYTVGRIRGKLQRDFDSYKRTEAALASQEKLLDVKERSLSSAREQLAKMIAKKRDYEIRLAQLCADEEALKVARMGTGLKADDSRAAEIEAIFTQIERRHDVQRSELELTNGPLASDFIPVDPRTASPGKLDLRGIRGYLEGNPTPANPVVGRSGGSQN
jgi:chromosome segregation ATPase